MRRFLIGCGALLLLIVGAGIGWRVWPESHVFLTDAASIKEPISTALPRDILWQPPIALAEVINSGKDDYEPRMSADGLTLYFVRGKAGQNADIYFSRRTSEGWTSAEPLSEVNSEADDLGAEPSADETSLYFYSNRDGGRGGYDLWVSRRGRDGWLEPTNLGPAVNSEFNDYGPALTNDGTSLYFSSNRPQRSDATGPNPNAWPATLREDFYHRTYDIYYAPISDNGIGTAVAVASLNTEYNEGAPALSPFGDFIYFASDRAGGVGGFDLYRSRRLRGGHEPPTNLGIVVNTAANELDPGLGMGGYALYFSSDRAIASTSSLQATPVASQPEYNLYQTTSREVFTETNTVSRPPIDWAGIWSAVGPNLLWALLALLLLLLMLALFRSAQNRKLSLLAKCLLASLAAHLLLMFLFNVWDVAASIAGEFSQAGRGPIQIALVGPSSSDALVVQVRGQLTDVRSPSPMELRIERHEAVLDAAIVEPAVQVPVARSTITAIKTFQELSAPSDAQPKLLLAAVPFIVPLPSPKSQIETALPTEPALIHETTVESTTTPPPVAATRLNRPATTALASRSDSSKVRAIMKPGESDPADLSPPQTLIAAAAPEEAVPQRQSNLMMQTGDPGNPPATTVASSMALALPAATTGSMSQPSEAYPPIAKPISLNSKRAVSPGTTGASTTSPAVAITPSSPGRSERDESFVASADLESTDSAPPEFASTGGVAQPPAPPRAPGFALPSLEARGLGSTSESRESLPLVKPSSLRASLSGMDIHPDNSVARVSTAPQSVQGGFSERSIRLLELSSMQEDATPGRPIGLASPSLQSVSPLHSTRNLDLNLPTEEKAPENPYVQRFSDQRMDIVERMGGSKETEHAVTLALQWLAAHQSKDGRWDADGFDRGCEECGGETNVAADHALTGLSLLCFLGAGHTHIKVGPYRDHVDRGLRWLAGQQKDDGDLRGEETMYSHGIATIALSEAFAVTGDPQLHDPVRRAAGFIQRARNNAVGGWRYDPGQPGDTSVLGWQVMALKSASMAGVEVPADVFEAARGWLDRVSERRRPGLYSYQPGQPPTPSMTAEGMFSQLLLGLRPDHRRMRESVNFILQHLPNWESEPSTYFWYYASLALFQHQGPAWETWNAALTKELTTHQRRDGRTAGSWDPVDEWSKMGGRVYQTALCTLMLEVYYRYLPLYSLETSMGSLGSNAGLESGDIGTIRGIVVSAATRRPIAGAAIRLDLSDRAPVTAISQSDGTYLLNAPATPDDFALSASRQGFVPKSANVERAQVEGRTPNVDFALEPVSDAVLVTEAVPEVHHLGDNHFDGTINSQFQKQSEGAQFSVQFELSPDQTSEDFGRAEVRLLAKGVQRNHRVVINGTTLKRRLNQAPEDGGFGEFIAPFDATLLRPGSNTLQIIAAPSDSDIDDFEFVNVQIRLSP